MDNYKILVTETENEEIQKAFFELGYTWNGNTTIQPVSYPVNGKYWISTRKVGMFNSLCWSVGHAEGKLITLSSLRDLVVLKRNDVKDATHIDRDGSKWTCVDFEKSTGHWWSGNHWRRSEFSSDLDLKPIAQPQDPALISGADAHKALLAGENVQYSGDGGEENWDTALNCNIGVFLNQDKFPNFKFRIVPRTIKLELELPKPFEPKEGDTFYYLTDGEECGFVKCEHDWTFDPKELNFVAWRTEEEIKQVVEQLRKIRGTNS